MTGTVEDLEKDIQRKVLSLCNTLPGHIETWKTVLKQAQNPSKALANFAEQLRFVEKADIRYMENFSNIQQELQCKILANIEEELMETKMHIEKLNKANHDLKNKLSTLERATIDLDWDLTTPLLIGSPTQPPLDKLLKGAYEFWIYFSSASKNINNNIKRLNVRDEKSMEELKSSLCLDLDKPGRDTELRVYLILALTQYVINEKAVT